jgi:hypothetical protein
VAHANARLTPAGRLLLCQRVAAGRPVANVASEMGISRTCPTAGGPCYQQHGPAGLHDRPSTAHTHPMRLPTSVEAEIARLRRVRKLGPARIEALVGRPASTVHRVLAGWASTGWPSWTGQPVGSSAATNAPTPASCSTSMSRNSAGCVPAVATASTAGRPPSTGSAPPDRAAARATTMSTPLWTTTPGWPTWRSPGRRAGRDLRAVPAPRRGVLRRPRHHHPARADRQRPRLPRRPWLPPDRRRTRR